MLVLKFNPIKQFTSHQTRANGITVNYFVYCLYGFQPTQLVLKKQTPYQRGIIIFTPSNNAGRGFLSVFFQFKHGVAVFPNKHSFIKSINVRLC